MATSNGHARKLLAYCNIQANIINTYEQHCHFYNILDVKYNSVYCVV